MATPAMSSAGTPAAKANRGKDQLNWNADVWQRADAAVTDEMTRSRQVAKGLPMVHVPKNIKTVPADVVILPSPPATPGASFDPGLSSSETQTKMVQEYSIEYFLSSAQQEDEVNEESALLSSQGASTFVSLAIKAANILAQAEEVVLTSGQNAFNHPLFAPNGIVQYRDKNLQADLDLGLLNIQPGQGGQPNTITVPGNQVVQVHPVPPLPGAPLRYAENHLDAVAKGVSILQAYGYFENYLLAVHSFAFGDLHTSIPTTLMTPAEPIGHLVTAGIYASIVPPFTLPPGGGPPTPGQSGLPTQISDGTKINGNVLYTGVLIALSGNSMDLVRGVLDVDGSGSELYAAVSFLQKDASENYRFRVSQRFALRLKDPNAAVPFLYLDS
jgi:hypothetical protein